MSETKRKPGFWDRLLGREEPQVRPAVDPAASSSEGAPDFTTEAEANAPAAPAAPEPKVAAEPPAEVAGADLQPVEGVDPEGGAPEEPVPRAEPAATNASPKNWWRRLS